MKAHKAVGLANPLYLPGDIPFEVKIIPENRYLVRSNAKRSPSTVTHITRHETGNFKRGADANMHFNWLNGNVGNNPKNASGYNCVNDDKRIIHLTPYDEVTWAGGTAHSNTVADHHELCVNADINHSRARYIASRLDAAVLHARGLPVSRLVQHNYWTGKNCPQLLREQGLWPWYVNQVQEAYSAIVAFLGGKPVDTGVKAGDTMLVTARLNVRRGPGTTYPVVATLDPGTQATVGKDGEGNYQKSATGYTWLNIAYPGGSGWAAMDWLQKVAPPKPAPSPGWPYPKPIIPPFWEDLMADGATHVLTSDVLWVRTNDMYRVARETPRLRVVGSDEAVGPPLKAGDMFRSAAVGQGYDGRAYVITPGLTRVRLDDLAFVTDD